MSLQRSMHLLRGHAGIKHSAFCSIVVPAVAGGLALAHATTEPMYHRKMNAQWEQYSAYLEAAKTKTTDINDPKFREPDHQLTHFH